MHISLLWINTAIKKIEIFCITEQLQKREGRKEEGREGRRKGEGGRRKEREGEGGRGRKRRYTHIAMGSWRKDTLSCEDGALGRTTSGSADSIFRDTLSRTPLLARCMY